MTQRHVLFLTVLQLLLFVLWLVGELAIGEGASATASHGGVALFLAHCGLGWIMICQLYTPDLRALSMAALALLLMPLPVYSLLHLMGGLSGFALGAIQVLVAGIIATGIATVWGVTRGPLPPALHMPARILLQFLPPLWLWSERSTLLSLVPTQ